MTLLISVIAYLVISFLLNSEDLIDTVSKTLIQLKCKRYVEDYVSTVTLKVKNLFPIRFENNCIIYYYRPFSLSVVKNKTNRIIADNFYFGFNENFTEIETNLTSSHYDFYFYEDFNITFTGENGTRKFNFYSNSELKANFSISWGTFILEFGEEKVKINFNGTHLRIVNIPRKRFKMCNENSFLNKTLLWWVEIKRGDFKYGGYIRWR